MAGFKKKATEFDVILGANIRKLRTKFGWSQAKLADILDITFQQVQKYENGSNRICPQNLFTISKEFNIDVYLLVPKGYQREDTSGTIDTPATVRNNIKNAVKSLNKALDYDNPLNTGGEF